MPADNGNVNILIFVTCEHPTFKHKYASCLEQWLLKVAGISKRKHSLKFNVVHVISEEIPPLSELKKFNGILISGSFSRISENVEWMRRLREAILLCYANQIPVFAICFGFQILSQTFGCSFRSSPHGFNFGAFTHRLELKALPFFRPYLKEYYSDPNAPFLFESNVSNGARATPNGKNHDTNHKTGGGKLVRSNSPEPTPTPDSMIGIFSHNDIITSLPNVDNIGLGEVSEAYRNEVRSSLANFVSIRVSSIEKVPVVGLLVGNKSKMFMVSVQLHPEFDSLLGQDFFTEVLTLKQSQGVITKDEFDYNLASQRSSNSGYIYGKMALALFSDGHLTPETAL